MSDPATPVTGEAIASAAPAAAQDSTPATVTAETGTDGAEPETPATDAPAPSGAILSEAQFDALVAKLTPVAQDAAKAEVSELATHLDARIDDLVDSLKSSGASNVHAALGKVTAELATLQAKLKHWL